MDLLLRDDPTGLQTFHHCRVNAPGVLIVVISGYIAKERHELFQLLGGVYTCKKAARFIDLEPIFRLIDCVPGEVS